MKKLPISIQFIILLILFITALGMAERAKLAFTEQSMEIVISPGEHMAKIENDVSFKVDKPVNEIKFLINKDIKIRKIGQKGKSLSYKLEKQFDISEYTDESDSSLQEEYKNLILEEIEPQYYINRLYDNDNFLEDDFTREITHWMPLPDPPIR